MLKMDKEILLILFREVAHELNLNVVSINHSYCYEFGILDSMIIIKWRDNDSSEIKEFRGIFSPIEVDVIKKAPREFKDYIKENINGCKGDY